MEILVIGSESNLKECREKFGEGHNYHFATSHSQAEKYFKAETVAFDFEPNDISIYNKKDLIVFLSSTKTTLAGLTAGRQIQTSLFGFCGMPSFLNREILELTFLKKESQTQLENICAQLNTKYKIVEDRVGMVTPRIICMIINEAYFSIEANVASRADIDLAMKLGTNYPFGPFEWCEKIGVKIVYELLNAVYNNTKDERYKICELLKKEAQA
ncbi:MAG: 3-hydroxyacyl-CoA dehydrogenase [Bacteroidetes bacterium]|nr:3-hydroxyacyl-CoA dehydrogenase [Bacteroidota bacterium]MBI3482672.1 3-hydroxyacyl-CoA dehydrogenase [Bacteroidota bacterium]